MAWRETIELFLTQWKYNCKKGEKQMFAEMFWLYILSLSLECHGDLMNWFLNILLLVSIDRLYNENQLILSSPSGGPGWLSHWRPPYEALLEKTALFLSTRVSPGRRRFSPFLRPVLSTFSWNCQESQCWIWSPNKAIWESECPVVCFNICTLHLFNLYYLF